MVQASDEWQMTGYYEDLRANQHMMPGSLSELKAQKLNDTEGLVKAKVPVKTKADTLQIQTSTEWRGTGGQAGSQATRG